MESKIRALVAWVNTLREQMAVRIDDIADLRKRDAELTRRIHDLEMQYKDMIEKYDDTVKAHNQLLKDTMGGALWTPPSYNGRTPL